MKYSKFKFWYLVLIKYFENSSRNENMVESQVDTSTSFSTFEGESLQFSAESTESENMESEDDVEKIKPISKTCELVEIVFNGNSNPIFVFQHPTGIGFYTRMIVRALQLSKKEKPRYSIRLRFEKLEEK